MQRQLTFTLDELKTQPRKVMVAARINGSVSIARASGNGSFRIVVLEPLPDTSD